MASTTSKERPDAVGRPALLLGLIVFAVTARALGHDFVALDDAAWIVDNVRVQAGLSAESLRWAFETRYGGAWQPLVWMSYLLDRSLFGTDAVGFHATSLALFTGAAVLFFVALRGWGLATGTAFVVALAWAVHPVQVESYAWVAERKGVLAGFWFMAALTVHARSGGSGPRSRVLLFACMLLGLMAKSSLLSLPFVLLVVDRGRGVAWAMALRRRIELLLLVPAFTWIGITAQAEGGALREVAVSTWQVVAASTAHALGSIVWPVGLSPVYATPPDGFGIVPVVVGIVLVVGLSTGAWFVRRRLPWVAAGWIAFLLTWLPFSGVVGVGGHFTADRYLLLPWAGLALALVVGAKALSERATGRGPLVAAVLVLLAWGGLSIRQNGLWSDSVTLFTHARSVDPEDHLAAYWLGESWRRAGDPGRAVEHYAAARTLMPSYDLAWFQEGLLLLQMRRGAEAVHALEQYLAQRPHQFKGWMNLGAAYGQIGRLPDALRCFERAVEIAPDDRRARANRDRARELLSRRGRHDGAPGSGN